MRDTRFEWGAEYWYWKRHMARPWHAFSSSRSTAARAWTRCPTICCCWTICGKSSGLLEQKQAATAANAAPAPCWSMTSRVVMPHARGRRSRSTRGYRRIARRGRPPFRSATWISRKARRPMRLLHARLHHGIGRPAAPQPAPERGRHPVGAGQQHLPLHRLRQNHRGGEVRRRAQRAGVAP
jgi:hypothetical protein